MSNQSDSVFIEADAMARSVVPESLKNRILAAYSSDALAKNLEEGNESSLYILSQLVYMNFSPDRIMVLAQKSDVKAIRRICKENLEGQALLHELQRTLFSEVLH